MINILANDGISHLGKKELEEKGFNISTDHISQEKLIDTTFDVGVHFAVIRLWSCVQP